MDDVELRIVKNSLDKLYLYLGGKYMGVLVLTEGQAITFISRGFESTWVSFEFLINHLRGES